MWIAAVVLATFLAATVLWHLFEHLWNRRLFHHTSEKHFAVNIRARTALQLIKDNPSVLPIDVRPEPSFAKSHLPGALNTPFTDATLNASELESIDRTTPLLVYCDGGYRSRKALPHLKKLGFHSIYHLHRGILSWKLRPRSPVSKNSETS